MKLIPPAGSAPSPRRGPSRPAQKAAIEKALSRYIALSCGHHCPVEVAEIYKVFSNADVFCERCGDFKAIIPRKIENVIPQEPLF